MSMELSALANEITEVAFSHKPELRKEHQAKDAECAGEHKCFRMSLAGGRLLEVPLYLLSLPELWRMTGLKSWWYSKIENDCGFYGLRCEECADEMRDLSPKQPGCACLKFDDCSECLTRKWKRVAGRVKRDEMVYRAALNSEMIGRSS